VKQSRVNGFINVIVFMDKILFTFQKNCSNNEVPSEWQNKQSFNGCGDSLEPPWSPLFFHAFTHPSPKTISVTTTCIINLFPFWKQHRQLYSKEWQCNMLEQFIRNKVQRILFFNHTVLTNKLLPMPFTKTQPNWSSTLKATAEDQGKHFLN